MRLCTARPRISRTWTVELRPRPQGPLLVCLQCALAPQPLQGRAARSAALEHLARHARHSPLPGHLRTCQCHERGCRWHPRHRGCDGPLLLLLIRGPGGRLWRLTDACTACARATPDACPVPETTLGTAHSPAVRRRGPRQRHGGQERLLVRDMLSYLASSLPAHLSAQERILALQCVLRSSYSGTVLLPLGLTRGLGLHRPDRVREELAASGWLRPLTATTVRLTDPLSGAPGRRHRARAADWAMRTLRAPAIRALGADLRLTALALLAHTPPETANGQADRAQLACGCGLGPAAVLGAVGALAEHRAIADWAYDPRTDELRWTTACTSQSRGRPAR
ncbi:hypothetical protein [Streptomyces sennicomposti]|uniref:hypothetical protein n=1 Tax=Streptomyces sennicomposti TaxID=2873384 RepID=UPI001CA7ACF6|nr:hypothetical protein [Streptomyces sennicomposti]MBY8864511.1 hypothetical protein [Streptomyces sennicomposti]